MGLVQNVVNPNVSYGAGQGAALPIAPPQSPAVPPPPPAIPSAPPGLVARPPTFPMVDDWQYQDEQQTVQGPFSTANMRNWCEAGYFTPDLPIKMTNWEKFHPLSYVFPNMATAFITAMKEPGEA